MHRLVLNILLKVAYYSHPFFYQNKLLHIYIFIEVLADPAVTSRMADTKAMAEVRALENFYSVLQSEPSRAFYGLKHVMTANEAQAIDTLLISDNLFR